MRNPTLLHIALGLSLLALLASPRPARAIGEQTGRIKGTISDSSTGARLPAATVSATSPTLIGGARTVTAAKDGRYELGNLPPGSYTLEISYPGMVPTARKATVQQGQTTVVNVAWSAETAATDTVVVSDSRPLVKTDSTQMGTSLRYEMLAKTPVRRSYQDVAQQAAGVSGGANPNIKGGLNLHNKYLVDGLDITDPVTGTFTANLTFDATESVDVITAGMEAQYNSLGGVINVITRGGSNEFHVNASLYAAGQAITAKGNTGPNIYDGRQPFNDSPVGDNESLQANITAGGPVIANKLWVSGSYELRLSALSIVKGPPLGVPPFDIQHPPQTSVGHMGRLKVTYAPNQSNRVSVSGSLSPGHFNNTSQTNSGLGVTESRQDHNNAFSIVSWDSFLTPDLSTNLQVGALWNVIEVGPQGRLGTIDTTGCMHPLLMSMDPARNSCIYDPNRPRHTNLADGTVWLQGGTYQLDNRYKVQVDPSVSWRAAKFGRHDVKAGLQMQYNHRTREVSVPGGRTYTDSTTPPMPLLAGLCDEATGLGCFRRTEIENGGFTANQTGLGLGAYIQDRWWTPWSWLTVVPGLRFDWGRTTNRNGEVISNMMGVGPRLGFIANVTRDSKTTVFAYYGRHTDTLSLLPASNYDAEQAAVSTTKQWTQATMMFDQTLGKTGGPDGVQIDRSAKTPHMDEASGGVRRAIGDTASIEVNYTYRHWDNLWAGKETNRIWDPTGSRVVGWRNEMLPQDIVLFTTPDDNERTYHGIDLIAQGSPTRNWDFGGSYTLSWLFGSGLTVFGQNSGVSQYDNPRQRRFFDGYLPGDIRHHLKLFGSYTVLERLSVGANFMYQTGTPLTKAFFAFQDGGYFNYRSPLGTEPGAGGNDQNTISEFRLPDRVFLDLRLMCNVLPRRFNQKLNLIVDVFNSLNTRTPTAITTSDLPTFGSVTARQAPLRVQLGLQYLY